MNDSQTDRTDTTESVSTRWTYTNDLIAGFLVLSFVGYVFARTILVPILLGPIELPSLNAFALGVFATGFGIAVAWTFGAEAVEAWNNKGQDEQEG